MKKIIFVALISLLFLANTNAKEMYTDYKFVGYEKEKRDNTELEKYEPVKFNRFFKEIISEVYEEEGYESSDYPYMNEDNYKLVSTNSLDNGSIHHTVNRINFGFEVDSIAFENISDESLSKIKILYENKEVDNLEVIKKGIYTIYKFDRVINPNSLTIKLNVGTTVRLSLNGNYIHQIKLDGYKEEVVTYENDENYKNILSGLNLNYDEHKFSVSYFENTKKLYQFYNISKEYYKDSTEEFIDGYTYLEEESYIMYKKYVREKISENKSVNLKNNFNENSVKSDEVIFLANVKDNYTPKIHNAEPIFSDIYNPKTYEPEVNLDNKNHFSEDLNETVSIKKPIVYRKINSSKTHHKSNIYLLMFTFLMCLILIFRSVKFKYKNAS